MRAMSRCTRTSWGTQSRRSSQFIGIASRRALNPAWSSAQIERARARAAPSAGQTPRSGNVSATYSTIASESQTTTSPSISTGTWPTGEYLPTRALNAGSLKLSFSSSNGMPEVREQQPRPQRPRRIVLVTDQQLHAADDSIRARP